MDTKITEKNGQKIAVITESSEKLLADPQGALDFIMTLSYETGCSRVAIDKSLIADDFFVLSTRLAGEILQKFINYHFKLAVYGDFSVFDSKALRDFIYESNKGNDIFFTSSEEEALDRLAAAR